MNRSSSGFRPQTSGFRLFCRACGLRLVACSILGFFLTGMSSAPRRKVYIKTLKNRHYQLIVNNKPYIVKGVCYSPIPIGKNHEYDWWSDPSKPWVADGKLMSQMGINTVRIYQPGENPDSVKQVIRDLYNLYGIRVILGHWLGFWEYPCPFYGDKDFQERVKKEVLDMVKLYKDEPGVLLWILGNENNYSCIGTVNPWSTPDIDKELDPQKQKKMRAKIYYSYVDEIAGEIHKIDPRHPVALGNGELIGLDTANTVCKNVDLVACIIYRGKTFGPLFKSLRATFDKPLLLSEFGADAYDAYLNKEDQNTQAFFLESQWRQVYENLGASNNGEGNCLGGVSFEWTDEWWKHSEYDPEGWSRHDTESNWSNGSYYFDIKAPNNMNMNEEWFGIVALSQELEEGINPRTNSEDKSGAETIGAGVNKRVPRKVYYVIREFWKNPVLNTKKKQGVKAK